MFADSTRIHRARTYPFYEMRAGPYRELSINVVAPVDTKGRGGGAGGWRDGKKINLPNTVMELETTMASSQTAAILKPTIRFVDV